MQASRKHAAYDMVRSLGIAERGSVINLPHELEAQGTLGVAGPLGRVFDGFPKYHIRDTAPRNAAGQITPGLLFRGGFSGETIGLSDAASFGASMR
jgi:hypothetical protein